MLHKFIYLILILIGLYAVFAYARLEWILARAHLPQISQTDQTIGKGAAIRYIAAGDSTAVGEGASNVKNSYTYQIADFLGGSHQVAYRNVAVIGSRTSDVLSKQLPQIISYNPDIVTISIGANDVTHLEGSSEIIANYKSIIVQLTAKTHAKIYITDVPRFDHAYLFPWVVRMYFDWRARSINQQLLALNTDRAKFVDIHSALADNAADQFHPSDKAYANWAQLFIAKIKAGF